MLQSKAFDFVIGMDIHIVMVPAVPSPIPTPVPMPFIGVIFDPLGLAIGSCISRALSGNAGIVLVNGLPVTNCGTNVINRLTLPHVFAPGTAFAMGTPMGNAELFFGSQGVSLAGTYGVRMGDVALTCSDPVRLPTGTVLARPVGRPFLNMKPMVPDLTAMAMAAAMRGGMRGLRSVGGRVFRAIRRAQRNSSLWRRMARRAHTIVDDMAPQRLRQALHRSACRLTGHPVDVATGRVLTDATDLELPGPLPFLLERNYDSSMCFRDGPVGHGWSHSFDQAVWTEPEKVIFQAEDGREIEFQLYDLPDMALGVGESIYHPIERLTLRNLGENRFEIEAHDGLVREFGPIEGRSRELPLLRVRTRDGHSQELFYNAEGCLFRVADACGRQIGFIHDEQGHLTEVWAPSPDGQGRALIRQFRYSEEGDLVEAIDALGCSWRYDYDGNLLVQETDRTGLSFYFQYDGRGPFAYCMRTWGDGGIYDHEIAYDKHNRKTIVTNSRLHTTVYEMDNDGLVVKVIDVHSGVAQYEYDEQSFQVTAETDPLGRTTSRTYDERGNLTSVTGPDGTMVRLENSLRLNVPVRVTDAAGGEWRWDYDSLGHLTARTLPTGETRRYDWEGGLLRAVEGPGDRLTSYIYDSENLVGVRLANGAELTYELDVMGRVTRTTDPRGSTRTVYDPEGRPVEVISPTGVVQRMTYDGEGNLLESQDATRHVKLCYGHFHKLLEREEDGTTVRFEYDTEDNLTAVLNEAGERYEFELDALGDLKSETGFDGKRRVYFRDAAGQIEKILLPGSKWTHLGYDAAGRVSEVKHFDGTTERYEYGPDGSLMLAANDETEVIFERDVLGRVVAERVGGVEVTSRYGADGARELVGSSLGARQAVLYDALGEVESLHHGPVNSFWRSEMRFGRDPLGAEVSLGEVESLHHGPVNSFWRSEMRFGRDPLGAEVSRELPGGIQMAWNRDASGKPISRSTHRSQPGARPIELNARGYQWRGEDQIASIIDAARGPRWFDHDGRGRLVRERSPGDSQIHGDRVLHRAMDVVGNVYRSSDQTDRLYGQGGQLFEQEDGTRYEHDDLGNLTKKILQRQYPVG